MARPSRSSRVYVRRRDSGHWAMSDTDTIPVTQLIRLVRDRPVLWDRQQEVYKNRKMTRQAWAEISEILIDNYDELNEQNQLAVGRNLMGKWANLRDNWLRYWRKRQSLLSSGSKTTSLKKYIHHDQLLFLSKVYDPECRAVEENVEEILVDVDVISDTDEEFIPDQSYDEASQNTWTLVEPVELPMQTDDDKCHLHFFHSILPMIQDLDNSQTLQLHTDILDCVRRVKFGTTDKSQKFVINSTRKVDNSTSTEDLIDAHIEEEMQDQANHLLVSQNKQSITTNVLIPLNNNTSLDSKIPFNSSECCLELTNLNNIVGRLEQISDTFVYSSFGDNYEQFGKYIASLMRQVKQKKIPSLKRKLVDEIFKVKPSCRLTSTKNYLRNKANKDETDASRVPPNRLLLGSGTSSNVLSTEVLPSTSEMNLNNSFSSISLLSTSFEENNLCSTHSEEQNISVSQQIPEAVTVQHKNTLIKRTISEVADSSNSSSLNSNILEGDTNVQPSKRKK